jgi:uncharacterized membrane protein
MLCTSCESQVPAGYVFCRCGVATGETAERRTDKALSALTYVTPIPALLVLAGGPRRSDPRVRVHAWQSLALWAVWLAVQSVALLVPHIGRELQPIVALMFFGIWTMCVIAAASGEICTLPFACGWAQKRVCGAEPTSTPRPQSRSQAA